jgi:hypothetical protein
MLSNLPLLVLRLSLMGKCFLTGIGEYVAIVLKYSYQLHY